jgi:hypothetical protein
MLTEELSEVCDTRLWDSGLTNSQSSPRPVISHRREQERQNVSGYSAPTPKGRRVSAGLADNCHLWYKQSSDDKPHPICLFDRGKQALRLLLSIGVSLRHSARISILN